MKLSPDQMPTSAVSDLIAFVKASFFFFFFFNQKVSIFFLFLTRTYFVGTQKCLGEG